MNRWARKVGDGRAQEDGHLGAVAARAGLERVSADPSICSYLNELWGRRYFVLSLALADLRSQNMHTTLGNVWHLLNPLLLLGIYYLIFGVVVDFTRGGLDNFLGFLAVGVFLYQYTQKAVTQAASSIVGNLGLIRSIPFPRATLPLAAVAAQSLAFVPALLVMLVFVLGTGEPPAISWLHLIPILVSLGALNVGGAFIVARLSNIFRDVQNILPFLFRLLFYGSGVLFPVSRFVSEGSPLRWVFTANPLYSAITLARAVLLSESEAGTSEVVSLLAWAGCALLLGFVFFFKGEKGYGRG